MKNKLIAIWNIIKSDKFAVFTWENTPDDPDWVIPDYFRWVVSDTSEYFFDHIIKRLEIITKYKKSGNNPK